MMVRAVWRFTIVSSGPEYSVEADHPEDLRPILAPAIEPALERCELHAALVRVDKYQKFPWGVDLKMKGFHYLGFGRCRTCLDDARKAGFRPEVLDYLRTLHGTSRVLAWTGVGAFFVPVQEYARTWYLVRMRRFLEEVLEGGYYEGSMARAIDENAWAVRYLPPRTAGRVYALILLREVAGALFGTDTECYQDAENGLEWECDKIRQSLPDLIRSARL